MSARNPHLSTPTDLVATSSQTVGPFFGFGLTTNQKLGCLATAGASCDRVRLLVRVFDGDGTPVPDAIVELWQADALGKYNWSADFRGFGRLGTDTQGGCTFETVRPGASRNGQEAAHINVCLFMRGLLRHVYTRLYFAGDPALPHDATLALVPNDRRQTLIARRTADSSADWVFDIHLQGEHETVFFDV